MTTQQESTYGNAPDPVFMTLATARLLNLPLIPYKNGKPVPLAQWVPNMLVGAYEEGRLGFKWFYWPL